MTIKHQKAWLRALAGWLVITTVLLFPGNALLPVKAAGEVVTGTVTDPNGAGMANVSVELHLADGSQSYTTTTNISGAYAFIDSLTVGLTWNVEVREPEGYNKPETNSTSSFVYQTGDATRIINFQLVAAPKVVSGKVTYANGTLVNDADINIFPAGSNGTGLESTHVGSDGTYTKALRPGKWFANAVANLSDQNIHWINEAVPVELNFKTDNSAETMTQNFVVTPATGNFKVILKNSDGSNLTTSNFVADVDLRRADGIGTIRKVNASDSGLNIFLTPGIYSVSVYHQDLTGKSFDPEKTTFVMSENGSVDLGTVYAEVNTAHLQGTVIDSAGRPISNVQLQAIREGGVERPTVNTNSNGTFDLVAGTGTWTIGLNTGPGKSVYSQVNSATATVKNGQTVTGLNVQLKTLDHDITGYVVNSTGKTVTDFVGSAYVRTLDKLAQVSAPVVDGAFWIQYASTEVPGTQVVIGVQAAPGSDYAGGREVKVAVNKPSISQNITLLPFNATLKGTLLLPNNLPATNAGSDIEVVAMDASGNMTSTIADSTTGAYTLPLSAGTWIYDYKIDDPDKTASLINLPDGHNTVTLKANETKTANIHVARGSNTITGTVLDANGTPVKQAVVQIDNRVTVENKALVNPNEIITVTTETNDHGVYSVKVPPGTYQVSVGDTPAVSSNQLEPDAKTVKVANAQIATINLRYEKSDATIFGTAKLNAKVEGGGTVTAFTDDGAQVSGTIDKNGKYSLAVTKAEKWHVVATDLSGKKLIETNTIDTVTKAGLNGINLAYHDSGLTVPGPVTKTFDADEGGTVSLPDGTKVNVTPYAIDTTGSVKLTVSPSIDLDPTSLDQPATLAYEVKAVNSQGQEVRQLNRPATITLPYKESEVATNGQRESSLGTKYWDPQTEQWGTSGSIGLVDTKTNTASLTTTHLTKFAVTGTSKALPKVAKVALISKTSKAYTFQLTGSNFAGSVKASAGTLAATKVVVKNSITLIVTIPRNKTTASTFTFTITNGNGRTIQVPNVNPK